MKNVVAIAVLTIWLLPQRATAQDLSRERSLYEQGAYEALVPHLSQMIEQGAGSEAYMLRADCLQKLGELSLALADYDRARLQGYAGDDLFLHRGICKWSLQAYESARQDLATFIERNPKDARGYYWMASVEYMNLDNKACLRYVDEALWIDSTYADAYYLRAANYMDQRKTNFALEDFESAYLFNPKNHRAKLNIAMILLDMGQYQNALEVLGELKNENVDFIAEVLYFSGEAMFRLHDSEGACAEWKESAESGDKDALFNYERICIDKQGKPRFKKRTYAQF